MGVALRSQAVANAPSAVTPHSSILLAFCRASRQDQAMNANSVAEVAVLTRTLEIGSP